MLKIPFLTLVLSLSMSLAHADAPRILVIGDSHSVGPFGHLLINKLKSITPKASLYASCGTVASSWLSGSKTHCGYFFQTEEGKTLVGKEGRTPKLPGMLNTLNPDLLIIELSGNYAKDYDEARAIEDMKRILNLIEGKPLKCLWVSAPDSRKNIGTQKKLYSWVLAAVGDRCKVVNGRDYTHYPRDAGDGIHYWRESDIKFWAQAVTEGAEALLKSDLF